MSVFFFGSQVKKTQMFFFFNCIARGDKACDKAGRAINHTCLGTKGQNFQCQSTSG